MKNNSELNEFIEQLGAVKKARKLASKGGAINLDGTTYTMHNWAIQYLPELDKAARILHEIVTQLNAIPKGHITMGHLTEGGIWLKSHDGVGGGTGKIRYGRGKDLADALDDLIGGV